jgi:2-dehydro-3-deoxyglucarate aldolase
MKIKDKLKTNSLTIGSWITLANPAIAEIMAKSGFDWLAVDLEHSVITINEAEELIRIIDLCGASPFVRISSNDPVQIKRVMDAGAHGIIVPMVTSTEDSRKIIDSVYYPPRGKRGVGLARAQSYGFEFERYKQWLDVSGPVIIVQIEHFRAVENLEAILSVEGIDGFIVGPYDLSASLGVPGNFTHPKMEAAMKRIIEFCKKSGRSPGIHVVEPDIDALNNKIQEGYRFIAYSLDIRMLDVSCREMFRAIK